MTISGQKSRLDRLEAQIRRRRAAYRRQRKADAAAVARGEATFDQCVSFWFSSAGKPMYREFCYNYYAASPAIVACVRLDGIKEPYDLLAFPPDQNLSPAAQAIVADVTQRVEEPPPRPYPAEEIWDGYAQNRAGAVLHYLLLAEDEGMRYREQIWQRSGSLWVLTEAVLERSTLGPPPEALTPQEKHLRQELWARIDNWRELPRRGTFAGTWADLADEALGVAEDFHGKMPWWSKQVKGGHHNAEPEA